MHTVKAMVLTVSLLGITAVASFAQGAPGHRQPMRPPSVQQHTDAVRSHHDGQRHAAKSFGWKQFRQQGQVVTSKPCTVKQHDKQVTGKGRWQSMSPAQRQAMKAQRQQGHQRWQQMTPTERKAAKLRMQQHWQKR